MGFARLGSATVGWHAQPPPDYGPPWFLQPAFVGASAGAFVAAVICLAIFLVLRSSTRDRVLKGTLKRREIALSANVHTQEEYERDTLKMTLNIEVEDAKKTLTID